MTPEWKLWLQQTRTILGAELRKGFLTKRGIWIWLLALAPVVLMWSHSIVEMRTGRLHCNIIRDTKTLAMVYHYFVLRGAIFFGCVGIFMRLFRGEVLEKSLHYYFLAPVRREVLLVSKFLAGVITALVCFGGSTLLIFAGTYAHFDKQQLDRFFWNGDGLHDLLCYLGVTAFACIGYGAVFTAMGMIFRNPIFPALGALLWESLIVILPDWLAKFSVIYYLKSMVPVALPVEKIRGPLVLLGITQDPVPAWVAVIGLACFTALVLGFASWQARRMEISYASD
jgi:ABC-type transport system involved in multi-copper enzyme maturation permease subunit